MLKIDKSSRGRFASLAIPLLLFISPLPAAEPYRSRTQTTTAVLAAPSLIVAEFAVPVAVPVAPFSPVWYASSAYVQANAATANSNSLQSLATQPASTKTDAGSNVGRASQPDQSSKTAWEGHPTTKTDAGSVGNAKPTPVASAKVSTKVPPAPSIKPRSAASVLEQRCASCHAGEQPRGGLNLQRADPANLPREVRQEILVRLTSGDAARRMPPGNEALTSDEFLSLVKEFVR